MNHSDIVLEFANKNNGIITTKDLYTLGINRWVLQDLQKANKLFRIQRGIYVTEFAYVDDFFLLQQRYPKGVYSFETALYLLGYSDRVPNKIKMTFLQGVSTVRMKSDNIRSVTISNKNLFELGVISVKRPGGSYIKIYEIERVLVELLKPRYNADYEQLIPAYKKYILSDKKNINKLFKYARLFGVEEKLRNYVEVLL